MNTSAGRRIHPRSLFRCRFLRLRDLGARGFTRLPSLPASELNGKESDEGGPPAEWCSARCCFAAKRGPRMLYVGSDLSRKRLDWLALEQAGQLAANGALAPDRDALAQLGRRLGDAPVLAVIESMSGAGFVHDQHEHGGWDVRIADATKARGLAPLACKSDRITAGSWPSSPAGDSSPRSGCRPARAGRARARPLPLAPGQAPRLAEEPRPRDPLPARPAQRTATCSAPAAAACSPASSCPSPGRRPSVSASR